MHKYVFSLKQLETIAKSMAEDQNTLSTHDFIYKVQQKIQDAYPSLIGPPENHQNWQFLAVGGSLAQTNFLYISTSEYLCIWGAPIPTEGFSGRFKHIDAWDIMLKGTLYNYEPGPPFKLNTYKNCGGHDTLQISELLKNQGKHYCMDANTYTISYGRGNTLLTLKAGNLAGLKYVTYDKYTTKQFKKLCRKMLWENLTNKKRRSAQKHYRSINQDDMP